VSILELESELQKLMSQQSGLQETLDLPMAEVTKNMLV